MGAPIANARKLRSPLVRILKEVSCTKVKFAIGLIINFLVVKVNWYILDKFLRRQSKLVYPLDK